MLFCESLGKISRPAQCEAISAPRAEYPFHLSISGLFQKKQAGWSRKCLFKYSTEVMFVFKILENSKVIGSKLP